MAKGDFKWYALSAAIGAGTLALMMWGCGQNQADESADVQPVEPVKEVVVPAEDARDAEIAKLRDSLAFVNGQLDECRNGKRCPGVTPRPNPQPKPQPKPKPQPAPQPVVQPVEQTPVRPVPTTPANVNQVVANGNRAAVVTGNGNNTQVVNQEQGASAAAVVPVGTATLGAADATSNANQVVANGNRGAVVTGNNNTTVVVNQEVQAAQSAYGYIRVARRVEITR